MSAKMGANAKKILVIHGPNLNLLGEREPEIYGTQTLSDLNESLAEYATSQNIQLSFFQSNHEGELIDAIQQARAATHGLVINPGGYTHTSVALRDALLAYPHPKIEVHLSNIYAREPIRRHSLMSSAVNGIICGLGSRGYFLALDYFIE